MKRLTFVLGLILVLLGLSLTTQAQVGITWTAQYYNNMTLSGAPTATLLESSPSHNWGAGAPVSGVGADQFSVRFSTVLSLDGSYEISVSADDGVRVYVNGVLLINEWHDATGQVYTATFDTAFGNHSVIIEYFENGGVAYLNYSLRLISGSGGTGGSWTAQYYNNTSLSGAPVLTRSEATPSHNWGAGAPASGINADGFSVRWASMMQFNGTYRLDIQADDGVRVWINGSKVIDEWHDATGRTYSHTFTLANGSYLMVIEYYENGGDAFLTANLTETTTSPNPPPSSGPWTAQYYNNTALSGGAVVTRNESSPTNNWGWSAPVAGVNADNFSVRWTTSVALNGTYRIDVKADDGVRVWVHGVNIIDEWHNATGKTYSHTFSMPNGTYPIVIEYYEAAEVAFLTYSLTQVNDVVNPPPSTASVATVTAFRLNFRTAPSVQTGAIIRRLNRGETYAVIGRSQDLIWWQLRDGNTTGWVHGRFVDVTNAGTVPVTQNPPAPDTTPTAFSLTTRANLNLRSGPAVSYSRLLVIPLGGSAQIVARNATNTWWKVAYDGIQGWVSGAYVNLPSNLDYGQVPVR